MRIKIPGFRITLIILLSAFCSLVLVSGCAKKDELGLARENAARSALYYQHAVEHYKKMIAAAKDGAQARFELGRLYYEHGDFQSARTEFEKTNASGAAKFLAMTDYRLGDYSGALEIFNRNDFNDDQSLYFYGLTAEKLNLYDQAVSIYRRISTAKFKKEAQFRIDLIKKDAGSGQIKELEPNLGSLLAKAPEAKEYPQAGALILSCDEAIEVNADGTQVTRAHYLIKILNERGKQDFAEAKIDYDSTYEKVNLEFARTIRPDGQAVEVGSSNIRDVSKYMNFPLYSNARLYIISFPEVSAGAVIEYKLTIYRSQLINKKDFIMAYPVQAAEPILEANFSVALPKERPLRQKTINDRYNDFSAELLPGQEELPDGRLIYKWQFKNLPQIIPEADMPPDSRINPTLLLSTFGTWQEVYDWWWPLAKDRISAGRPIKDKVRELTRNMTTAEQKLRVIYDFCAQDIRYVAVEYGQAGYQPHQAEEIFRNKYGDCKDQAVLLVTMLREAGITAYPVLISTYDYYDLVQDQPSALFDHCIAVARIDGRDIFLDPTASTCSLGDLPPADQQRKVLIFEDAGYRIQETPLFGPEHNTVKQEMEISLDAEGAITARRTVTPAGFYGQGQRYWLLYTQPELIKEALKEKIQSISIGSRLLDYQVYNLNDLDKPPVLRYDFSGPEYFTSAGPLRIIPALAGLDTSITAKDKRRYPLDLTAPDKQEIISALTIPDNYAVKYMPDNIAQDSPWFAFEASYSRDKNKLVLRQTAEFKKRQIPQEDYAEFKKLYDRLAKGVKQNIILERKK